MDESFLTIYVTCSHREEALHLGRKAVEARLAACANVLPGMTSLYWWEGSVQSSEEAVLLLKSKASLLDALTASLSQWHSYELPCIVAWPIAGGNEAYLHWIDTETTRYHES